MDDITEHPAHELSRAIRARELCCRELMQATLARIERLNYMLGGVAIAVATIATRDSQIALGVLVLMIALLGGRIL